MSEQPIRVAITGGGIAGATLLHALLPHSNLDTHIFESASEFKEAGMAIGVARNAFQALELIGHSAREALEKAGSIPHHGVKFMLATGSDAGKMLDEIDARKDGKRLTSIVHRAAFLKELLAGVPTERMHASKKLTNVEKKEDGSLILHFADGGTHACDVLIGADGIHSVVRKIILGDEDKAATPVSAGWFHAISLQPYEKMRGLLGDEFVDLKDAREWGWVSDGTFMMHNVLSGGQFVQYIATVRDETPNESWKKTVGATDMKQFFQDYPSHLQNALAAVIGDEEYSDYMCTFEHLPARTYVDGPICIMGDAAHATTPWQGSGGGISIEDALVLSSLLACLKSPREVPVALQVYDEVRRPRTQRVVLSSKETGLILTGRHPEYSLNAAGLQGRLKPRWDFILDFDNAKAREEAVEMLQSRI